MRKNSLIKGFLLGLALLVGGCVSSPTYNSPGLTPEEAIKQENERRMDIACTLYASTLLTITLAIDDLNEDQKNTISLLNALVDPICLSEEYPEDTSEALRTINRSLRDLQRLESENN